MTPRQGLALKLSHEILHNCAEFCSRNEVKKQKIDEALLCMVALQSSMVALLSKRSEADATRLRMALIELLTDDAVREYIDDSRVVNTKGLYDS